MGVYRSAYLGPYVEMRLPVVQQKRDRCREPEECPEPGSGYCEQCGIKVADRWDTWDTVEHDPQTLMEEEFNHALMVAESNTGAERDGDVFVYYLIPNQGRNPPRALHISDETVGVPVQLTDLEEETAWFEKAFVEEIQGLRLVDETLEIKWGFLQWHW